MRIPKRATLPEIVRAEVARGKGAAAAAQPTTYAVGGTTPVQPAPGVVDPEEVANDAIRAHDDDVTAHGGVETEVAVARGVEVNLAARIGAVEAAIDDAVEDHDQDEAAHGGVELEVEAARDGHASLENRLDAIEGDVDTVTGDLAQLEEHLADTADGSSGADLVGATSIAGLTGNTVQALLSALKGYIDGTASAAGNVPVGGIIAWSGSIASIPENWALCDGTGGTPDLRDRFVVGAGNGYAVGATGGAATHTLSVAEMPAHTHTMPQQSGAIGVLVETTVENISNRTASTYATSSTGGGEAHENRPPYYALAWIMRTA